MNGFADKNTKLALVGGIYFSVAMIVAIGFTIRGAEVQARNEAAIIPAQQLTTPAANAQEPDDVDVGTARNEDDGAGIGMTFDAGDFVEPAFDLVTKRALRRVVF